jgi:hypothetical protein
MTSDMLSVIRANPAPISASIRPISAVRARIELYATMVDWAWSSMSLKISPSTAISSLPRTSTRVVTGVTSRERSPWPAMAFSPSWRSVRQ